MIHVEEQSRAGAANEAPIEGEGQRWLAAILVDRTVVPGLGPYGEMSTSELRAFTESEMQRLATHIQHPTHRWYPEVAA